MNEEHRAHDEQASDLSQLLTALLVTLISVAMLLGSFLLAELDTALRPATPTQVVAQRPTATPFLPTLTHQPSPTVPAPPASATPTPTEHQETARPTEEPSPVTPTVTPPQETTPAATPIRTCTRPPGWVVYTVRKGDTLAELARRSGTTLRKLMYGNCLGTTTLFAGQRLYVPRTIYVSPTPEPYVCGPPLHWVIYFVKPGDTLYSLSRRFHVTVEALRRANCLRSNAIDAGQALYVPPLPSTPTPWPTFTPSPSPTPSLTPSPSSTATAPPTSTSTPTVEPTLTLLPTRTSVPPTPTQMPTSTPSSTPVGASPSPTFTATPLPTSTSMPTAPPTATPTTRAPTQTFTFTPVPTETPTPSPIPTATSASTTTHSCTP